MLDATASTWAADQDERVGGHPVCRGVGGRGRTVAVADDSQVGVVVAVLVRLVRAVEPVDELREEQTPGLGVALGRCLRDVQAALGITQQGAVRIGIGGVVSDPGDRGYLDAIVAVGCGVQVQRLLSVLVDQGAVLHDAGDVDGRVVGSVGITVGDGGDAVPTERVRLVGQHVDIDVQR